MGYKDLVISMIESGSYVNNTNSKNKDVVKSLSSHHKNLDELVCSQDKALVKRNISFLVNNMKEEFILS